jgi:hypothetical protein
LSPADLFDDHDGHSMPGAFRVSGGITLLAPFNWIGPAISLVVMQLVASLALLRALHVLLGWRPVLLLPLTFALFVPLGLPAFAWWAAALNAMQMIAALAWVADPRGQNMGRAGWPGQSAPGLRIAHCSPFPAS